MYSDMTSVTVPLARAGAITLTVHPACTMRGALDARVPRPVYHGKLKVWAEPDGDWFRQAVADPGHSYEITQRQMVRETMRYGIATADIASDGTFQLTGLPKCGFSIIAACDGWVSAFPSDYAKSDSGWYPIYVAYSPATSVTLAMVQTGSATVRLRKMDGTPIRNATVRVYTTMNSIGKGGWPGSEHFGISDQNGNAYFPSLPPTRSFVSSIENAEGNWMIPPSTMPATDGWFRGTDETVTVKSGETAEVITHAELLPAGMHPLEYNRQKKGW
jgi:hypothetical protein